MRFDTTPKLPVSITVKRAVLDAAMMLEDHCAAAGLDATEAAAWLADWAEIGWPWGEVRGYLMHYEAADAGTLHTITVIDGPGLPAHARDDLARLPQKADDLRDMLDLRIPF